MWEWKKNTRNPELQLGSAELEDCDFRENEKCQKSKILKVLRFPPKFFRYLDLTHKIFGNIIRIWRNFWKIEIRMPEVY